MIYLGTKPTFTQAQIDAASAAAFPECTLQGLALGLSGLYTQRNKLQREIENAEKVLTRRMVETGEVVEAPGLTPLRLVPGYVWRNGKAVLDLKLRFDPKPRRTGVRR